METKSDLTKVEARELFQKLKETDKPDERKAIRDRLIQNYMYIPKLLTRKYAYKSNKSFAHKNNPLCSFHKGLIFIQFSVCEV